MNRLDALIVRDQVDTFTKADFDRLLVWSREKQADPRPVDVTLSKIIVAYPWLECGTCQFVWPLDSNPDPKYNRQCPACDGLRVFPIQAFTAYKMQYAYEWLLSKMIDVVRREHARTQPAEDRQPSPAGEIARDGEPRRDRSEEGPRHGDALQVQTAEAPPGEAVE